MTGEVNFRADLLELLDKLCNDQLSQDDENRLRDILASDPESRLVYQHYLAMNAELYWLQDAGIPERLPAEISSGVSTAWPEAGAGWVRWATLAAVLLIGSGLGFIVSGWMDGGHEAAVRGADRRMERVAEVTGSLNCLWRNQGERESLGFGAPLFAGQELELAKGVAEITFQNGARVILQAPARLDVASYAESILHEGQLTATCPPGAEGFRINTAGLTLIDRGTEFGVTTDRDGNTEVHVFQGLVEGLYREGEGGSIRKAEWRTDETVYFSRRESRLREIERPTSTYLRSLASSVGPMNGVLASEDFDYPLVRLHDKNGGFGWGGAWESLLPENPGEENLVKAGRMGDIRLQSSGNHAALLGNFNRIRRKLNTSIGGVFDNAGLVEIQDGTRLIGAEGKTVYISFVQRVSALDQVFYGFELNRSDRNKTRVICIGNGAARGWTEGTVRTPDKEAGVTGWAVTSEFNGEQGLREYGELGRETTREVFIVAKITFGRDHDDLLEVFVNPSSYWDESSLQPDVTGKGNFAFDRISLANFEGHKIYEVDRIRVGTSLLAVTDAPWVRHRKTVASGQPAKN